jgi:hypothetical protein
MYGLTYFCVSFFGLFAELIELRVRGRIHQFRCRGHAGF